MDRRVGDFVDGTSATPVMEIASAEAWEIVTSATASSLQRLRPGQVAEVVGLSVAEGASSETKAEPLRAVVTNIARAVDPVTGAGDVRLNPATRPPHIALGSSVRVRIAIRTKVNAVVVPVDAIRKAADGTFEVVVVEASVAHVRKVEVGLSEGARVEIVGGLAAGARVVVDNPIGIAEGASVTEETPAAADEAKDAVLPTSTAASPSPIARK